MMSVRSTCDVHKVCVMPEYYIRVMYAMSKYDVDHVCKVYI